MTEAELEYKQYEEQERVIAYRYWQQACNNAGGVVVIANPVRQCYKTDCVPDKADWDRYRRYNRVRCVKLK